MGEVVLLRHAVGKIQQQAARQGRRNDHETPCAARQKAASSSRPRVRRALTAQSRAVAQQHLSTGGANGTSGPPGNHAWKGWHMKLAGTTLLHAPSEQVFSSMQDPKFLVRTIPGCHQLETTADNEYRVTINAGVSSIKGTYLGTVRMLDTDPPHAYTLKASGRSAAGNVDAEVRINLLDQPDGMTELRYNADALVGGAIGGVGQRVLAGAAKRMASEFFRNVDTELSAGHAPLALEAASIGVPEAAAATEPNGVTVPTATGPGEVFRRQPPPPKPLPEAPWFAALAWVAVGAAIALAGVALGARVTGRRTA